MNSTWIRNAAVGFVVSVAQGVTPAVLHTMLLPELRPCLAYNIIAVDEVDVLMGALKPPLSRTAYNYIINLPHVDDLLQALGQQKLHQELVHKTPLPESHQRVIDTFRRAGAGDADCLTATIMGQHLMRVSGREEGFDFSLVLTRYPLLLRPTENADVWWRWGRLRHPLSALLSLAARPCRISLRIRRATSLCPPTTSRFQHCC